MFRNNLLFKSNSLYSDDDVYLILNQYDWNYYFLYGDKFQSKFKLDLPYFDSIDEEDDVNSISILGSGINGILCIYDFNDNAEVVLWNPFLDEHMKVPYSLAEFPDESSTKISLHGFGYDHVRDDYKIIEHVAYSDAVLLDPFWEIYSLKSNSWRKINYDMPIRCLSASDVYLNGVCHWWGEKHNKTCLVSFNLCDEVFLTTPSPLADVPDDGFDVQLMVLNGSIALISNQKETASYQISTLGEFGVEESWIRLFDVELLSCEWPIGAGTKGKIFFRKEDDELACFDLTTGLIEDIGFDAVFQVIHYKITFRSIGEINV
jgi:F-box interacting protein